MFKTLCKLCISRSVSILWDFLFAVFSCCRKIQGESIISLYLGNGGNWDSNGSDEKREEREMRGVAYGHLGFDVKKQNCLPDPNSVTRQRKF